MAGKVGQVDWLPFEKMRAAFWLSCVSRKANLTSENGKKYSKLIDIIAKHVPRKLFHQRNTSSLSVNLGHMP